MTESLLLHDESVDGPLDATFKAKLIASIALPQ